MNSTFLRQFQATVEAHGGRLLNPSEEPFDDEQLYSISNCMTGEFWGSTAFPSEAEALFCGSALAEATHCRVELKERKKNGSGK